MSPHSGPAIRHVIFRGRVQGVGFRAFVQDIALGHAVEGWVRNRRDGTVEALFAGDGAAVERTIATCRKGPRGARVDGADVREANADDLAMRGQDNFAVLPTI